MVKIRLVIVDKREVVRQGLERLLGAEPNFEVVGTADTAWDIVFSNDASLSSALFLSVPLYQALKPSLSVHALPSSG